MTEPVDHQESSVKLGTAENAADLKNLVTRIRSVDSRAAVRLVAHGQVLAVYVCTLAPGTLLDTTPTVLGMRAMRLMEPAALDVVVEGAALLDRLARIDRHHFELSIPPVTVNAVWAGVLPPMSGWTAQDPVSWEDLRRAAQKGIEAVESALPQNPGHAVVDTVRSRIWSSPCDAQYPSGSELYLPTGAAFAGVVLGFLGQQDDGAAPRYRNGNWVRLSLPAGYVLVRQQS